jgi:hypothetical protein
MATNSAPLIVARWVARGWSILSILVVLVFAIGEVLGGGPRPTLQEWVGLALWPVGVGVGLCLAWYREGPGGIFALGCLIAFYAWNLFRSGQLPRGPFFCLIAAPGVLFLIAGFLSHRSAPPET